MQIAILALHILASLAIIILVLMQHGKGADAGAAFGSGASNTMFGSVGAMSFFMKLTAILAAVFFVTSLALSYLASHQQQHSNQILDNIVPSTPVSSSPASPKNEGPASTKQ
ncbi:MAG: preprotein translocase subunit SecG [Proteobacteria bacterium]|nr:preprotein translocase subunit SecG [Pseudomonadota bacterium]